MISERKYLREWVIFVTVLAFVAVAGFSQTKKEVRQWKKCIAQAEKTFEDNARISIYKQFIARYPGHFFLEEAGNRIAVVVYKGISAQDDTQVYRDFIEKYPQSLEAVKAGEIVADDEDFQKAKTENTVAAFRNYLQLHPEGRSIQVARVGILGIRLADKSSEDMVALLRDHGLQGQYTPNDSPGPYQSMGFYSGDGFCLTLVRYADNAVLNIADLVKSTGRWTPITMEGLNFVPRIIPNGGSVGTRYKTTREYSFTRWDPFFIFIVAKDPSPAAKLEEVYNDLLK